MNELVSHKEHFYNYVHATLSALDFVKSDQIYMKSINTRDPGMQMIINGRITQRPGQLHKINLICELWGSGADGDVPMEFIRFQIQRDDQDLCDFVHGLYHDDLQLFDELVNRIFNV